MKLWNKRWSETQYRSISKVITWRILVSASHFVTTYLLTGSVAVGLGVVSFALVVNSILYWLHERSWNEFEWGRRDGVMAHIWTELQRRSISKVVTWRITVMCSNFVGAWWVSGDPWVGVAFMSISALINSTLYWVHERLWNITDWGRKKEEIPATA